MTSDVAWIFMISLRVPWESLRHLRPTRLGCGQGKVGCRHFFSHQSRSMILRQGNAQAWRGLKVLGCIGWWFNRFYKWCFKTLLKYQTDGYLWSNTIQYPRLSATPLQTQGWQMANCTHLCHLSCKSQQNSARFNAWCISDANPTLVLRFVLLTSTPSEASAVAASFSNLSNESHQLSSFSLCHHHLHHLFIASPTVHPGASLGSPKSSKLFATKKKHMIKHPILIGEPPIFLKHTPAKRSWHFPGDGQWLNEANGRKQYHMRRRR